LGYQLVTCPVTSQRPLLQVRRAIGGLVEVAAYKHLSILIIIIYLLFNFNFYSFENCSVLKLLRCTLYTRRKSDLAKSASGHIFKARY